MVLTLFIQPNWTSIQTAQEVVLSLFVISQKWPFPLLQRFDAIIWHFLVQSVFLSSMLVTTWAAFELSNSAILLQKTGYDEAGWEEEEEECSQCDVASSDGHSRGEAGGGDPRVDTRGIHRAGRLTIDNRRCISFDLPNMAKKPHSTSWMYGWISESQYRLYIERSKGSKFTPESL